MYAADDDGVLFFEIADVLHHDGSHVGLKWEL